jgi:glutathione S-transferase
MAKFILYIFAISHYCEKARWALDYLGIELGLVHLAPGLNAQFAKKHKLPSTSLPILKADDTFVQGSSNIIDWADQNYSDSKTLTPESHDTICRDVEQRLDELTGVNIRRHYYSEALVEYPDTVEPPFTKDLPLDHQQFISNIWTTVTEQMANKMDLGFEQGEASKIVIDNKLIGLTNYSLMAGLIWLERLSAEPILLRLA